jgi:chromate reductase
LVFTDSPTLARPEVLVYRAHVKFDAEGRLTDEQTRHFVSILLRQLADWTHRMQRSMETVLH